MINIKQQQLEIRGVVFDMDGLMFNTEDLYDEVTADVLARYGKTYSPEIKLQIMGTTARQAFDVMTRQLALPVDFPTFQTQIKEVFHHLLPDRIEKMPGLDQLLDTLESRGIPKGVATSSDRQFARTAMGCFDLEPRFEFVITGDDVQQGKPHPEIYLASAKRLGIEPACMIALEDSFNGSTAAALAGAFTIAVPTHHSRHQDFSHADLVVTSLWDEQIVQLFQGTS